MKFFIYNFKIHFNPVRPDILYCVKIQQVLLYVFKTTLINASKRIFFSLHGCTDANLRSPSAFMYDVQFIVSPILSLRHETNLCIQTPITSRRLTFPSTDEHK